MSSQTLQDKIEQLKRWLESDPGDSFTRFALALELRKSGNTAEAEKLWTELIDRDPAYTGTYYHLGKLLEETGRPVEARRIFSSGITKALERGEHHTATELEQALHELD